MDYRVLEPSLNLKTLEGSFTFLKDQIVTLPLEIASELLRGGKIEPVGKVAYRIYSNILQAYLWVVADDKDREAVRASQGITEAIYSNDEIKELRKLSKEDIKEIHKVKEIFSESTIKEVKRHDK